MRRMLLTMLVVFVVGLASAPNSCATPPPLVSKASISPPRRLMVHYMPWYQSQGFSGTWGWHWTMNHYHPDADTPEPSRSGIPL